MFARTRHEAHIENPRPSTPRQILTRPTDPDKLDITDHGLRTSKLKAHLGQFTPRGCVVRGCSSCVGHGRWLCRACLGRWVVSNLSRGCGPQIFDVSLMRVREKMHDRGESLLALCPERSSAFLGVVINLIFYVSRFAENPRKREKNAVGPVIAWYHVS